MYVRMYVRTDKGDAICPPPPIINGGGIKKSSTDHFQSFFFVPPTLNLKKKNPVNQLIKIFWPSFYKKIWSLCFF